MRSVPFPLPLDGDVVVIRTFLPRTDEGDGSVSVHIGAAHLAELLFGHRLQLTRLNGLESGIAKVCFFAFLRHLQSPLSFGTFPFFALIDQFLGDKSI